MSRYPETDLSRIVTYPVGERRSLVAPPRSTARPRSRPPSRSSGTPFRMFWRRGTCGSWSSTWSGPGARRAGVLVLAGAHVLKTGLAPGLIRLMEEGWITALALNGAGADPRPRVDVLRAHLGGCCRPAPQGTLRHGAGNLPLAQRVDPRGAATGRKGWGRARPGLPGARGRRGAKRCLLATAYRLGVPATVHLSIGSDINHQHPSFSGAAAGETTARDFRILCHAGRRPGRGVALNLGSAVVLPEVFLKAISVSTNLGIRFPDLTTAVFDFQKHYRPLENVVKRPALQGGRGIYLVGHHEILLPLFFQAPHAPERRGTSIPKP